MYTSLTAEDSGVPLEGEQAESQPYPNSSNHTHTLQVTTTPKNQLHSFTTTDAKLTKTPGMLTLRLKTLDLLRVGASILTLPLCTSGSPGSHSYSPFPQLLPCKLIGPALRTWNSYLAT